MARRENPGMNARLLAALLQWHLALGICQAEILALSNIDTISALTQTHPLGSYGTQRGTVLQLSVVKCTLDVNVRHFVDFIGRHSNSMKGGSQNKGEMKIAFIFLIRNTKHNCKTCHYF